MFCNSFSAVRLDKASCEFTADILGDKRKRNEKILEAVDGCGYTQREVADYLGLHFTSVSRIVREIEHMLKK